MRVAAIMAALLLCVSPLLVGGTDRSGTDGRNAPFVEFTSDLPGLYNTNYNDTDGDGLFEIFCFGHGFLRAFDPPNYREVLSLDGIQATGGFQDLGNNGSIQIPIYYGGADNFLCSVISGNDFKELWRSPPINGSLIYDTVKDVDGDGWDEFIWIVHDDSSGQNISRVQVWGWENRSLDWESPLIEKDSAGYDSCTVKNIDSDPQPELILDIQDSQSHIYNTERFQVYDGLTHELQWAMAADDTIRYLAYRDVIADWDNDSRIEVMLNYRITNASGANISGFLLLSGETGEVLWNVTTAGNFYYPKYGDLDGDGANEVLISGTDSENHNAHNTTFEIFDLKRRQRIWALGPCEMNSPGYSEMSAPDLDRDGRSEILFTNNSFTAMKNAYALQSFQILDGVNRSLLWSSPAPDGCLRELDTALFCTTERPVMLLTCCSVEEGEYYPTYVNGSLRVISTKDFSVLWESPVYPGKLETWTMDMVGDSRDELFLTYQYPHRNEEQMVIIDTRTFSTLWMSPETDGSILFNSLDSFDIVGDSGLEFIFMNESYGMIYSGGGVHSVTNSTFQLYNGTSFEELWRSETMSNGGRIDGIWDLDNDSNVEIVLNNYLEGYPDWGYYLTVWEFPRALLAEPGIYSGPPGIDLRTPRNGDVLWGQVNISGIAMDDYRIRSVEVRIDNGTWLPAVLNLSADRRAGEWILAWNASEPVNGTHRISARSFDGERFSSEVSVTVTVQQPKAKRPRSSDTTLGAFPDPLYVLIALAGLSAVAWFIVVRRRRQGV